MSARYILRLDDIAPNMHWENYSRLRDCVDRLGIAPLIAVVPDNRDPFLLDNPACPVDFWDEMRTRQESGWKLAMHGYQHLPHTTSGGTLGLADRSEFAGLPADEQLEKLSSGRRILEREGIRTDTFVAPGHSFDANTERALLECGFTAMSDGFALYPYVANGIVHVPQLFSTPWHPPLPLGVWTFCLHLNTMSRDRLARIVRFLEREADRFIRFDDAAGMVSSSVVNRVAGTLARRLGVGLASLVGQND